MLNCLAAGVGSVVDQKVAMEHESEGDLGYAWLKTNFAGSGPFKIRDWRPNEAVVLERNDSYTGTKAPLARVIYEAATHCRPVIAYATGGIPEAIRHCETGWLAPRGDIQAWRTRLAAYLDQPEPSVGLAARALFEEIAAPTAYAAKVTDLYHQLLNPSSESRTQSAVALPC